MNNWVGVNVALHYNQFELVRTDYCYHKLLPGQRDMIISSEFSRIPMSTRKSYRWWKWSTTILLLLGQSVKYDVCSRLGSHFHCRFRRQIRWLLLGTCKFREC